MKKYHPNPKKKDEAPCYHIRGNAVYLHNTTNPEVLNKALEVLRQISGPRDRKVRKDISKRFHDGFED